MFVLCLFYTLTSVCSCAELCPRLCPYLFLCSPISHHLYALEKRLNFKTYVFVYRCLNGLASPLLRDRFTLRAHGARTAATTRGQVSAALVLHPANTRYGFSAISYLGAARWNTLPLACRMSSSPAEFRSSIKIMPKVPCKKALTPVGNSLVKEG